jgi:subtilisin family serine protease
MSGAGVALATLGLLLAGGPHPDAAADDDRSDRRATARTQGTTTASLRRAPPPRRVEGQQVRRFDRTTVLVKFRRGVSAPERQAVLAPRGARVVETIRGTDVALVEVDDAEQAQKAFDADPRVATVELNRIRYAFANPNDPRFATEQQYLVPLRLPSAWDVTRGSTAVKIAILDTGVDLDHPDLASRVVAGRDFVNDDAVAQDDEGHGTLVAGIAGAATNNGIGIAGAAWNASIMPVKVLDETGAGSDFDIANAITWAADNGAHVINLSLGAPGSSVTLFDAVEYARAKGALVVAATGNDGWALQTYPAIYADLAVGATDAGGDAAWFSNSGYWVDVTAPGIDVTSTALAAGPVEAYARAAGTSLSSPIVAGIAALVRTEHPGWGVAKVTQEMLRGWDRGPRGLDPFYGLGLVDAYAALGGGRQPAAPQPPGDGNEPDGAPKRATPILTSAAGTFSPEGDKDVYAVDVGAPRWFSATVTPPPLSPSLRASEVDPRLDVIGPQGQRQIGSAIDNTAGRRESVLVPAGTAGRYFLETTSIASARGTYSLTVADAQAPAVFADEQGRDFPGVEYIRDVAVADVTGDGRKDVLSATTTHLMLLPQRATGGLGDPTWFPMDQNWSFGVAPGDFDGDGLTDVAVATMAGPKIFYSRNGSLAPGPLLAQPSPPREVEVADVDRDGRLDVLSLADDGFVRSFRNGTGGFTSTVAVASVLWRFAVGDLSGDGRPDIVGCAPNYAAIEVYVQDGSGAFTKRRYDTWCGDDLAVADFTGDGRNDLATNGIKTQVFPQTAAGTLGEPDTYHGLGHGYLAAGDLNADSRADLVAVAHYSSEFVQLSQLPNGQLATAPIIYRAWFHDGPMAIGDVTGDGKADVVLAQNGGTLVTFPHAASSAPAPLEPGEFWLENIAPHDFALGVPSTTDPVLDFGNDLAMHDGASLISGLSGREAPTGPQYDHSTLSTTVRPATGLAPGTPYVLAQQPQFYNAGAPRLSGAQLSWRFATSGAADVTVPDTTLVGDPQYFPDKGRPVFTFTGSKVGTTFECALDAMPFVPCTSPRSYETFEQPPGEHTFRVRAIDAAGTIDPTPAALTWTVPSPPVGGPANDAFANAIRLRAGEQSFQADTTGATKEPGEPNHAGFVGGRSVWFTWKAPRAGTLTIDTRFTPFDTLLAVYSGTSVSSLTPIASNDNVSPTDTTSRVTFSVSAGTVYRIAIDGKNGASGRMDARYAATLNPPANDNFAAGQTLTGPSGTLEASNVAATAEPGEAGYGTIPQPKSIWYRWTAPRSGLFSFDINGSAARADFDLYTGSSLAALTPAGVKAFLPGTGWVNQIYLVASGGVTYIVRLNDAHTPGDWVLNWRDGVSTEGDTTPPETTILEGPAPATDARDAAFNFVADEPGSTFACSLDGAPFASCSPPKAYSALALGAHRFEVRATDAAGHEDPTPARREWTIQEQESSPPSNPTLTSSHTTAWSNDRTVDVTWSGASDEGSGVDGYSYEWSLSATTLPDTVKEAEETATGTTSPDLADGSWWFHLRTGDNAGNWSGAVHLGPFRIDGTAPANPTVASFSHTVNAWSNDATVELSWTGAADGASGVDGYSYQWSQSASTVPDQLKDSTPTNLPLGEGSWWFHLRTVDAAGNWSGAVHLGPFRIDTVSPTNPTLASPGHAVDAWSNDPTVELMWPGAADEGSGVDGYSYLWSPSPSTLPDETKDSSPASGALADGDWWFHLRTRDNAGNWSGAVHLGPFRIDTAAPSNPALSSVSHAPGDWSNDPTVEVSWSGAADTASGVDGYSYEWSQGDSTTPDAMKEPAGSPATSPVLADGSWWFHLRTRDLAGNWSGAVHLGPFKIDTTAPTNPTLSSPSHAVDTWSNAKTVTVEWSGAAGEAYSYEWSHTETTIPDDVVEGTDRRVVSDRPDGSWWFHVRTRNTADSWSGTSHIGPFLIDTTPPETTVASTGSGFELSASEEASFRCSLNDGAYAACVTPVRYDGLPPGEHVFRAFARDRAGNVDPSPAEVRWTIAAPPQPQPQPPPPPQPQPPPPPPRQEQRLRCVVPKLTGSTLKRARTLLARGGCRLGRVTWAYARVRRGLVVRQTPRAGRRLVRGARVGVVLSRGALPRRR